MNKLLLTFNTVLLIAIAYLYFAFYSKPSIAVVEKKTLDTATNHIRIVYFDMDTLEKYYTFAKETRDYLKGKNDEMESKLNQIRSGYQDKVNDYNKRGASMSQTEQSQMQEDLARMQNTYDQQQQSLGQAFQAEYMQKMLDLKNKIQEYLKKYCSSRGYQYVFATSSDDNVIYYKDSVRDITSEIVDNLNAEYKNSKKK